MDVCSVLSLGCPNHKPSARIAWSQATLIQQEQRQYKHKHKYTDTTRRPLIVAGACCACYAWRRMLSVANLFWQQRQLLSKASLSDDALASSRSGAPKARPTH